MKLCRADKVLLVGAIGTLGSVALFGASVLSVGVPLAIWFAVMTDGIARPASSVLCPTISRVNHGGDCIALTFDDGPDPLVTPKILDLLNASGARGTFFVIGRSLERNLDVARRALDAGHELGNHSWQHAYFQSMHSTRALARDVDSADRLLNSLSNRVRMLYRAPVGIKSPPLARVAKARGLTVVAWSIHSRDTIDFNPKRVAARVLRRIRPGDIVLMHDGHDREGRQRACAVAALPYILAGLKERNLRSVTVSELLDGSQNLR
jgi:peptidoglycan-N-acetylglucosamine deacetylase